MVDANVYIFAFGIAKLPSCASLVDALAKSRTAHALRICRTIVEEVRDHLTPQEFREFILFIHAMSVIDEDAFVPFELGSKYEWRGLKPADAFIAAYTEWVGAEVLVTENRHFLTRRSDLPFKVCSAEQCLRFIAPTP